MAKGQFHGIEIWRDLDSAKLCAGFIITKGGGTLYLGMRVYRWHVQ